MRNLVEYLKTEYHLVNRMWMFTSIFLVTIITLIITSLLYSFDSKGELNEYYFKFGDNLLVVGIISGEEK